MDNPDITVYIANYNYSKYLEKCILSIVNQTFKNFELIIIDDGSIDNSKRIIQKYFSHFNHVIFQDNYGLIKSNNRALSLAKGTYIIRVDSDDYLRADALEILYREAIKNTDCTLIFPDYYLVNEDGMIMSQYIRFNFKNDVTLFDLPAHGACTLVKTSYLREIGGYNEKYSRQDGYYLWLNIVKDSHKVCNINEPLFFYRQHSDSITTNKESLYKTRCEIKSEIYNYNNKVLCVIPFRGNELNVSSDFHKLQKYSLTNAINNSLNSNIIDKVIFTTSNNELINFFRKLYCNKNKLSFYLREEKESLVNQSYVNTISTIIRNNSFYNYIVIIEPDFPFISKYNIEEAIYTIDIFNADVVDSVKLETDSFYVHDGKGLKPLRKNNVLRYERDDLFKKTGGISCFKINMYNKPLSDLIVGHIEITDIQSIKINQLQSFDFYKDLFSRINK